MIRKVLRILLYSIFPIYLLAMFYLFDSHASSVVCQGVTIHIMDSTSAPYLKKAEVEKIVRKKEKKIIGLEYALINTYDVEQEIAKNPVVRHVACYKTPSGIVRVDIHQRTPIIRIMGIGGNYFIDEEGAIMPVTHNYTAYVPIVTGYISKDVAQTELLQFAKYVRDNSFWRDQIEQVHILSNGEVELIPRVGKHTILLGEFRNFEKKLDNLYTFYEKGLNKKGWNLYKSINLKYENQVIGVK